MEQIDPLVNSLRGQDEFVHEYNSNRMVIDIGHRFTLFKGQLMAKGTTTLLTGVELEFKNAKGSVKVKANKMYKELVNPDIYDIIATHPDYEPFLIEGVKIQAGEIKVENIELVAKV